MGLFPTTSDNPSNALWDLAATVSKKAVLNCLAAGYTLQDNDDHDESEDGKRYENAGSRYENDDGG